MLIRAGYEISLEFDQETPVMGLISVHPSRAADLRSPALITSSRPAILVPSLDDFGNVRSRMLAPVGPLTLATEFLIEDSGLPDQIDKNAQEVPVTELPNEALRFLLGSRYCETDRMVELAWSLFGKTLPGYTRVQAICDYVHNRLTFGYGFARNTRTAFEAHEEQVGVCRDFAHLAITLCRCMNIPARYATGYLGDIGVPADPAPMDFSAWFEVYLGGRWVTLDARHNHPRIGRILMAHGRDAADCAITTSFGEARLTKFRIITEEVSSAQLRHLFAA